MASNLTWDGGLKSHTINDSGEEYGLSFSDAEELECLNKSHRSDDSDRDDFSDCDSPAKGLMMVGGLPAEMIINEQSSSLDMLMTQEDDSNDTCRRSSRQRKEKRSFSPVIQKQKRYQPKKRKDNMTVVEPRPFDKCPDGQPFVCDLCQSPYICNSRRKVSRRSKSRVVPRQKVDPTTGKTLILCNACGLSFDRKKQPVKLKPQVDPEAKEQYLKEAQNFSTFMASLLSDPQAERLSCPTYTTKGCRCLQRYITGNNEYEGVYERASAMLALLKEAKQLSALRCNDPGEGIRPGLGSGQKRSHQFEDFVLSNRRHLKEDYKLCERAIQRVLVYSNNFLHKRLKTEANREFRAERVKGKAVLGLLTPINELQKERCCVDNCVVVALTHERLLTHWRERAGQGQIEQRRVIAEMLTPSGGARPNCNKFIMWVTGCSTSTICKVRRQMRTTGGDREPPIHGMKKHWENMRCQQASKKKVTASETLRQPEQVRKPVQVANGNMVTLIQSVVPNHLSQINSTREQIMNLEKQLEQQQLQLKTLLALSKQGPGHDGGMEVSMVNVLNAGHTASTSSSPAPSHCAATPADVTVPTSQTSDGVLSGSYPQTIQLIWSQESQTLSTPSSLLLVPPTSSITASTSHHTAPPANAQHPLFNLLSTALSEPAPKQTSSQNISATSGNRSLKMTNSLLGSLSTAQEKGVLSTGLPSTEASVSVLSGVSYNSPTARLVSVSPQAQLLYSHEEHHEQTPSQVEAVVQQILDMTGNVGLINSPSKTSSFLQQLSEYGSTIAPNVNISLIQPTSNVEMVPRTHQSEVSQSLTSTKQDVNTVSSTVSNSNTVSMAEFDGILDPSSTAFKYVLTIEQGATGDTNIPISLQTVDALESGSLLISEGVDDSHSVLLTTQDKDDSAQPIIDFMHM